MPKISPVELYKTIMEVGRSHKEPRTVNLASRLDYQRQRSARTNWLDWYSLAKRYHDDIPLDYRLAMHKVHWSQVSPSELTDADIFHADVGVDQLYFSIEAKAPELIAEGQQIFIKL